MARAYTGETVKKYAALACPHWTAGEPGRSVSLFNLCLVFTRLQMGRSTRSNPNDGAEMRVRVPGTESRHCSHATALVVQSEGPGPTCWPHFGFMKLRRTQSVRCPLGVRLPCPLVSCPGLALL